MDSTPVLHQIQQQQQQHKPSSSSSKLPIKRKTHNDDPLPLQPDPPPFKFHRIWTEPDEIRFLQGLLDCNLSFPRDLGIFYSRFSNTMSQPYTKSQLSEKLRRLRKKFRVISTRLSTGFDHSQLSLHDRALYDLSRRLWHEDFAETSPFNGARNVGGGGGGCEEVERSGLVGIKVDFMPTLPVIASGGFDDVDDHVNLGLDDEIKIEEESAFGGGGGDDKNDGGIKLSEVNVEFEEGMCSVGIEDGKIGEVAGKAMMDVFDKCLKEVRMRIESRGWGDGGTTDFRLRWQQQRVAELNAVGNRLRLVLQDSLRK